ncbi:MAG: ABC transporter transmembrane domain-containing protein [Bacteroidota bacterium]
MQSTKESDKQNHWRTLKTLGSHLWPKGRTDLRIRVVFARFFLALAKILNVYVAFLFYQATDLLSPVEGALMLPVALIVAYGGGQVIVALFGEFRDLIFVRVAQHAQRTIALSTFKHLHHLSLDFHLSRQTGGLSRVIERGTRGIQFVLNFMTFNIVPTLFEITLVTGVLVYHFNILYAAIIFFTIVIYIAATLIVTEWRLKYRRAMNSSENKANTKAIDSLINYETVKYFGNEEHEYGRFDTSLAKYEAAAIQSQGSLSLLNVLQSAVIGTGLVSITLLTGRGVIEGRHTIGDFILVNMY